MILLPFLFGLIFVLLLAYKLLGGHIHDWLIWLFAILFFAPIVWIIIMEFVTRLKNRKGQ